jgi:hypothetical protein
VHREHTAQVESGVPHDLGPRPPVETRQLLLDELTAKADSEHNVLDTGVPQEKKMPLEQAPAAEPQQAFGKLAILRLLQTKTATGGENDGTH